MTTEQAASLPIVLEAVFCDFEQDPEIQDLYFERAKALIASIEKQRNEENWRLLFLLFVSEDKGEIISRFEALFSDRRPDIRMRVVRYRHPEAGYRATSSDNIDAIKNPNRLAARRHALFAHARDIVDEFVGDDRALLRTVVDDDDIFTPRHFDQLALLAQGCEGDVVGIGIASAYVAYVGDHEARLHDVVLTVAPSGLKAVLLRNSAISQELSGWDIPDVIDRQAKNRFARLSGGRLRMFRTPTATWCYMRRGRNLSQHDKSHHVSEERSSRVFSGEAELLDFLFDRSELHVGAVEIESPLKLRVRGHKEGDEILVTSNFNRLRQPGDRISYVLRRDHSTIAQIEDCTDGSPVSFGGVAARGDYQIKARVLRDGAEVHRASTRHIIVD